MFNKYKDRWGNKYKPPVCKSHRNPSNAINFMVPIGTRLGMEWERQVEEYQISVSEVKKSDYFYLSHTVPNWVYFDPWGRPLWHAHVDQYARTDASPKAGEYKLHADFKEKEEFKIDDDDKFRSAPTFNIKPHHLGASDGHRNETADQDGRLEDNPMGIEYYDFPKLQSFVVPALGSNPHGAWYVDHEPDTGMSGEGAAATGAAKMNGDLATNTKGLAVGGVFTHLFRGGGGNPGVCNLNAFPHKENSNMARNYPCMRENPWATIGGGVERVYSVHFHKCPDENGKVGEWMYTSLPGDDEMLKCPAPPPPEEPPLPENRTRLWNRTDAWEGTLKHVLNPFNDVLYDEMHYPPESPRVVRHGLYNGSAEGDSVPGYLDNVWVPAWRTLILDHTPPRLSAITVEGTLIINGPHVELHATSIHVKGGTLLVCEHRCAGSVCTCAAPLSPHKRVEIVLYGEQTWQYEVSTYYPNAQYPRARRQIPAEEKSLQNNGELNLWGYSRSHSWAEVAETADVGATSIVVGASVDWDQGDQIAIATTDYDSTHTETRAVKNATRVSNGVRLDLDGPPLKYRHVAVVESYGNKLKMKNISMRAEVALLTRNVVVRSGDAAGYMNTSDSRMGARVATFDLEEKFQYQFGDFRKTFTGRSKMSNVELRECGRQARVTTRPGPILRTVVMAEARPAVSYGENGRGGPRHLIVNCSIVDSYGTGMVKHGCVSDYRLFRQDGKWVSVACRDSGISAAFNVVLRSVGPSFMHVAAGKSDGRGRGEPLTRFVGNVAMSMRAPVHSESFTNLAAAFDLPPNYGLIVQGNVVAGSERVGFKVGGHRNCRGGTTTDGIFLDNRAHSCFFGVFLRPSKGSQCDRVQGLTLYRIWEFAVYVAKFTVSQLVFVDLRIADANTAILVNMMDGPSLQSHLFADTTVSIEDSLLVGRSAGNAECLRTPPHTSNYLGAKVCMPSSSDKNVGIMMTTFTEKPTQAPAYIPAGSCSVNWHYPGRPVTLGGSVNVQRVIFANYGRSPCASGERDFAVTTNPESMDDLKPHYFTATVTDRVDAESTVYFHTPSTSWVYGGSRMGSCFDMDCDGLKHAIVYDTDGGLTSSPSPRTIVGRAEFFSPKAVGAIPPFHMFTSMQGAVYQEKEIIPEGYGRYNGVSFNALPPRCDLLSPASSNAWSCTGTYRRLIIESMDGDWDSRRISPVALSTRGRTDLLRGAGKGYKGTFFAAVATPMDYKLDFTSTNPTHTRLRLVHPPWETKDQLAEKAKYEGVVFKIWYSSPFKLVVYVDGAYVEDGNYYDGKYKGDLVRWGKMDGPHVDIFPSTEGGSAGKLWPKENGANAYHRPTRTMHVAVKGRVPVDIKAIPVVQVALSLSVSVAEFYTMETAFVESLCFVLQIPPHRMRVVNVVPDTGTRRRRLGAGRRDGEAEEDGEDDDALRDGGGRAFVSVAGSAGGVAAKITRFEGYDKAGNGIVVALSGTTEKTNAAGNKRRTQAKNSSGISVDFEITPDPVLAISATTFVVAENATLAVPVIRSANPEGNVTCLFTVATTGDASASDFTVRVRRKRGAEEVDTLLTTSTSCAYDPTRNTATNTSNTAACKALSSSTASCVTQASTGCVVQTTVAGSLSWAPHETDAVVEIYAVPDGTVEGANKLTGGGSAETLVVRVLNATGATLGAVQSTSITIESVDVPAPLTPPTLSTAAAQSVDLAWDPLSWIPPTSAPKAAISTWEIDHRLAPKTTDEGLSAPGSWASSSASTLSKIVSTAVLAATVPGLTVYTLYEFRVRAVNAFGASAWGPVSAGIRTQSLCGDGTRQGDETCDDKNTADKDGCSMYCTVEPGFGCSAATGVDVCRAGCGNKLIQASSGEDCDDGNLVSGDGCSSGCRIEVGYRCSVTSTNYLSKCTTQCGDGLVASGVEQCDDANTKSGDGCSAACNVEAGFNCTTVGGAATKCIRCGDGRRDTVTAALREACDDGGVEGGDGCSARCTVEPGWVCDATVAGVVGGNDTCRAGAGAPQRAPTCEFGADGAVSIGWMSPDLYRGALLRYEFAVQALPLPAGGGGDGSSSSSSASSASLVALGSWDGVLWRNLPLSPSSSTPSHYNVTMVLNHSHIIHSATIAAAAAAAQGSPAAGVVQMLTAAARGITRGYSYRFRVRAVTAVRKGSSSSPVEANGLWSTACGRAADAPKLPAPPPAHGTEAGTNGTSANASYTSAQAAGKMGTAGLSSAQLAYRQLTSVTEKLKAVSSTLDVRLAEASKTLYSSRGNSSGGAAALSLSQLKVSKVGVVEAAPPVLEKADVGLQIGGGNGGIDDLSDAEVLATLLRNLNQTGGALPSEGKNRTDVMAAITNDPGAFVAAEKDKQNGGGARTTHSPSPEPSPAPAPESPSPKSSSSSPGPTPTTVEGINVTVCSHGRYWGHDDGTAKNACILCDSSCDACNTGGAKGCTSCRSDTLWDGASCLAKCSLSDTKKLQASPPQKLCVASCPETTQYADGDGTCQ